MIKLLLDPQIFNQQIFGGISRYYAEIFSELQNHKDVKIDFPLLYTRNIHYNESSFSKNSYQRRNAFLIKHSKFFKKFTFPKLEERGRALFIEKLHKQNFDLFIPTYFNPDFLEHLGDKPFVLTVYDMIYELFPHYFTDDTVTVNYKKLLIEKATKIIAISESAKADIISLYPHIDASKIEVVYLAHTIKENPQINLNLPSKYILFVGNRAIYKNFTFFLKAVAPLLESISDLYLICAGGYDFNEDELQLLNELNVSDKVIQQNFEDAALATYYKNAQCFIFPSQYEGFGIPILESMACGCPVVLANHSSFPEVAGDAGVYFKLDDPKDLSDKVLMLLENSEIRKDYSLKGLVQEKKFNWQKTADQCLVIYKKALECKK